MPPLAFRFIHDPHLFLASSRLTPEFAEPPSWPLLPSFRRSPLYAGSLKKPRSAHITPCSSSFRGAPFLCKA